MRLRSVVAVCCALVGMALVAAPAQATFPGQNGKIAFSAAGAVMTISPDGTELTSLGPGSYPAWSPDGQRLAFVGTDGGLWVMEGDGSNRTRILALSNVNVTRIAWSPDGSQLVYKTSGCAAQSCNGFLHIVNADGSGDHFMSLHHSMPSDPDWSPDGTRILYWSDLSEIQPEQPNVISVRPDSTQDVPLTSDGKSMEAGWRPDMQRIVFSGFDGASDSRLRSMNADGSGRITIPNGVDAHVPAYSPDASKIAYVRSKVGEPIREIRVIDAEGSNGVAIYQTSGLPGPPDWQPIPVNGYPRPKGATPFQTYLVPAYQPCMSPNRTHGPPLAFGSCSPPASASSLTVGTPDANAKPAKSVSVVRFSSIAGIRGTPADEADVLLDANITDVYERSTLADYEGNLSVATPLRITDKLNTPHPGGPGAGTVSDTALGFDVPCAATGDTTVGSTCALTTTYDTLIPGAVTEGRRSIWALGQVEVRDSGGAPFMRQGIFVP